MDKLTSLEMDVLTTAEEAARLAGDVLTQWVEKFTVSEKSPANLVTEADFASQEVISKLIQERFPDHHLLGEEGLSYSESNSPYRWVIDPLDGTSNYVHRFPYYAVSIAIECQRELLVGVIFDPNRDELFSAVCGKGATLNGNPITTTKIGQLRQAMGVASLPVGAEPDDPAVDRFLRALRHLQTVHRTGSAALNLAYVACGRIEAFWSSSLRPWDMAAGTLIVREAGGRVSKMSGEPLDIEIADLLATNGSALHDPLQQLLA